MPLHRAGQHRAFHVGAESDQVLDAVAMAHPDHVLFDDRTFVEVGGHIVGGGPDQLDAALVRLLRAGEPRPRLRELVAAGSPAAARTASPAARSAM